MRQIYLLNQGNTVARAIDATEFIWQNREISFALRQIYLFNTLARTKGRQNLSNESRLKDQGFKIIGKEKEEEKIRRITSLGGVFSRHYLFCILCS